MRKQMGLIALLLTLAAFVPANAQAQTRNLSELIKVSELQEKGARRLTRDDLMVLIPGSAMTRMTLSGSTHSWRHGAKISDDGGPINGLQSNRQGQIGVTGGGDSGKGAWFVDNNGQWCVVLQWTKSGNRLQNEEKYCRVIFELAGTYYGISLGSLKNPEAKAQVYAFERTQ